MMTHCDNCINWTCTDPGPKGKGDCRLNPPARELRSVDTHPASGVERYHYESRWPETKPDQWCSEHSPKPEPEKTA